MIKFRRDSQLWIMKHLGQSTSWADTIVHRMLKCATQTICPNRKPDIREIDQWAITLISPRPKKRRSTF